MGAVTQIGHMKFKVNDEGPWPTRDMLVTLFRDGSVRDTAKAPVVALWLGGPGIQHVDMSHHYEVFGLVSRSETELIVRDMVRAGYARWAAGLEERDHYLEMLWPLQPSKSAPVPNGRAMNRMLRNRVMKRDGGRCVFCGSTERLALDHIIPFEDGGATTEENLRVLCTPCNLGRGHSRRPYRERAARAPHRGPNP